VSKLIAALPVATTRAAGAAYEGGAILAQVECGNKMQGWRILGFLGIIKV
jgi:hypothetical protein